MVRTYYSLTKPGIIRGNLLTAAAGFLLAAQGHIDYWLLAALLGGVSLVIASACVCNNYLDRHIDRLMARTKKRALAEGTITNAHAMAYAALLGLAGFLVLIAYTNLLTTAIGLFAFFAYVVLYGVAKRRSTWGTLVGSISGAAPPIAGYTAVTNRLDGGATLLFLILVFWQMPHFYAIAIYRFKDYRAAGLPVLPVQKGIPITKLHMLLYTFGFAIAAPLLSVYGYAGYPYRVTSILLGAAWLGLCARGFRTDADMRWARTMFFFSLLVITILCIAIGVDAALH